MFLQFYEPFGFWMWGSLEWLPWFHGEVICSVLVEADAPWYLNNNQLSYHVSEQAATVFCQEIQIKSSPSEQTLWV